MKIRVSVVVDIDPDAWVDTFGTDRKDVRSDVRQYVENAIARLPVFDEVSNQRRDHVP